MEINEVPMKCLLCKGKRHMLANIDDRNLPAKDCFYVKDNVSLEPCPRCKGTGTEPLISSSKVRYKECLDVYVQYYDRYFRSRKTPSPSQKNILNLL